MNTCQDLFAFGYTLKEIIVMLSILGIAVACVCSMVRYLNGPPHVNFLDLDLYSKEQLKEMKRKGLRR